MKQRHLRFWEAVAPSVPVMIAAAFWPESAFVTLLTLLFCCVALLGYALTAYIQYLLLGKYETYMQAIRQGYRINNFATIVFAGATAIGFLWWKDEFDVFVSWVVF